MLLVSLSMVWTDSIREVDAAFVASIACIRGDH